MRKLLLFPKHFILFVVIFTVIYFFLLTFYYQNIANFGCFDDCSNFMTGWFLTQGKVLYQQIFYNHQPLPTYISAGIQLATNPQTIYQLVLYHRVFIYALSYLGALLLIYRFGSVGFFAAVVIESTKYYFFGDRFLAEGMIVYPLIYMFGVTWQYLQLRKIARADVYLSAFFTWFVIFMREPLIPLALFLFGCIVFIAKMRSTRLMAVSLFLGFTFLTLLLFPFSDYFFSVVAVNSSAHLKNPYTFSDIFAIVFYPGFLLFSGKWNTLHTYLILLSVSFLLLITRYLSLHKRFLSLAFVFVTLLLANLRPEPPGTMFYESFHMLPWYALFVSSIFFFFATVHGNRTRSWFKVEAIFVSCALVFLLLSPGSYLRTKTDRTQAFFTGYNQYYSVGEVVRRLSTPKDTLFLDGWNDLIYWQAQRTSAYPYSWYTSVMPAFSRYQKARTIFLEENSPDFFYGACTEWPASKVSESFLAKYQTFYFAGKPTCLHVHKEMLKRIPDSAFSDITQFEYTLKK